MNRTLIIAILIVVFGGGYYFFATGNDVGETVSGAMETTSDAVETATETASETMNGALFSAEGYDAAKIAEMIDASGLDEGQKSGFKTALQAASNDPAMLTSILGQVKEALGI